MTLPTMAQTKSQIDLAVIANDINYIKKDVAEIKDTLAKNYVSREEFEPVKRIVYGLVGLILVSVMVAILALIIQK